MEEMDIKPEYLMKQIAQFRKSAGLTHGELAQLLDVPVCFTEILENGILVRDADGKYESWYDCLLSRRERLTIAAALSRARETQPLGRKPDDEFVFYCPLTVSGSAIEQEMQVVADEKQFFSKLYSQLACVLGIKMRLYYAKMCMCGRMGAADIIMQSVLSMLRRSMRHCR